MLEQLPLTLKQPLDRAVVEVERAKVARDHSEAEMEAQKQRLGAAMRKLYEAVTGEPAPFEL